MRERGKAEYYLGIAAKVAEGSTCLRRQYGAVIVKNDRVISTGFNGSARGAIHCSERDSCWRKENNIPHGEQYEKCMSVHAEVNAIIFADPNDLEGATLYLAGTEDGEPLTDPRPCEMCSRIIQNAGIAYVVNDEGLVYWDRNNGFYRWD